MELFTNVKGMADCPRRECNDHTQAKKTRFTCLHYQISALSNWEKSHVSIHQKRKLREEHTHISFFCLIRSPPIKINSVLFDSI